VAECVPGLFNVRLLVQHVVFVFRQVIHDRIIHPQRSQDEITQFLDAPEFLASNVVHLSRHEVIHYVSESGDEIIDIHEDAMVPEVYVVRQTVKRSIREQTHHAAIIVVVLSGTVGVEESQSNHRVSEPFLEIHDLNFIHPFGHRVIVVLDNRVVQRNVFRQDALVFVAVNFRR
jgi:hypothetical protein